jgi:transcriptional regulator with XRE-family HTH domain
MSAWATPDERADAVTITYVRQGGEKAMAKKGDPAVLRFVVVFLRTRANLTQAEFGRRARVSQGDISHYENGKKAPPEEALRRMAAVAQFEWRLVVLLTRFYEALLSAAEGGGVGTETDLEQAILKPALLALAPYLVEDAEEAERSPSDEMREAKEVWAALEPLSSEERRVRLRWSHRAARSWALAVTISHASERAAADRADDAVELAQLALEIAEQVPWEASRRERLIAYCRAYLANALRVANGLVAAGEMMAQAKEFWRHGTDPEGLLEEWRLLDLEASLCRAQQRFAEALDHLAQAEKLAGADREVRGRLLLKKQNILQQAHDNNEALAVLLEAAPLLEGTSDPRLLFTLRYNTAANLSLLGRHGEAQALLPGVRELARGLGNGLDLVRVDWLAAHVAAGLGKPDEAEAGLEEVRRYFESHKLPCEQALAGLDLALILREQGRWPEIQRLAAEMVEAFQAQNIHRETIAAVILFQEAAAKEAVSVELVRRLQDYLKQAQAQPGLRFAG